MLCPPMPHHTPATRCDKERHDFLGVAISFHTSRGDVLALQACRAFEFWIFWFFCDISRPTSNVGQVKSTIWTLVCHPLGPGSQSFVQGAQARKRRSFIAPCGSQIVGLQFQGSIRVVGTTLFWWQDRILMDALLDPENQRKKAVFCMVLSRSVTVGGKRASKRYMDFPIV